MLRLGLALMVASMDALPALSRPFVMQTDLVGDEHFLLPAGTVTFLLAISAARVLLTEGLCVPGRRRIRLLGQAAVGSRRQPTADSRQPTADRRTPVYVGIIIFVAIAILLVVAFVKVKQRQRRYEEGQ